jgi:hypothetical protein
MKRLSAPKEEGKETSAVATRSPGVSRFMPAENGRRLVLDSMIQELTKEPTEQSELKTVLEQVFTAYEEEAKRLKFENDVAGAMTLYLLSNYQIYTGSEDPSDNATKAVVQQIRGILAEPLKDSTSAEKQKMYEAFIVTSGITILRHQVAQSENNAGDLRAVKESAGATLKELLKAEPDTIQITEQGIVIKSKD